MDALLDAIDATGASRSWSRPTTRAVAERLAVALDDARRAAPNGGGPMLGLTWLARAASGDAPGGWSGRSPGSALAVLLLASLGTFFTASRAR